MLVDVADVVCCPGMPVDVAVVVCCPGMLVDVADVVCCPGMPVDVVVRCPKVVLAPAACHRRGFWSGRPGVAGNINGAARGPRVVVSYYCRPDRGEVLGHIIGNDRVALGRMMDRIYLSLGRDLRICAAAEMGLSNVVHHFVQDHNI